MDEVWPGSHSGIDVGARVAAEPRPTIDGRPWVTMLMISSLDGAAALDGVSGGLGGPADKAIFGAMRSMADVIMVGGGTAHAEDYGPVPRRTGDAAARREAAGQSDRPQLAILSRSLPFSPDDRLFSDATARPVIYTVNGDAAQQERQANLRPAAELVTFDGPVIPVAQVVADLGARGHRQILLEGGPRLNDSVLTANLVDEVHLSLAPMAVGGGAPRIIAGSATASDSDSPTVMGRELKLHRIWMGDGLLFLRYVRPDPGQR